MSDKASRVWRFGWTLAILGLWMAVFTVIHFAVVQAEIGYEINRLNSAQETLQEQHVQLQCELATLHDLSAASLYAVSHGLTLSNPANTRIFLEGDRD